MVINFNSQNYNNYSDAYNNIVNQVSISTQLTPQQIADCLQALATIAPYPAATGSVTSGGTIPPVVVQPPDVGGQPYDQTGNQLP